MTVVGDARQGNESLARRLLRRRLSVAGLPAPTRAAVGTGLVATALISTLVVAQGFGFRGGEFLPSHGPVLPLVIVAWLVGLVMTSLLWSLATRDVSRRAAWVTRSGVALVGATVGAFLVRAPEELARAVEPGTDVSLGVASVFGWTALAAAFLTLIVPRSRSTRWALGAAVLGATPFVLALGAYVSAGSTEVAMSESFVAAHPEWPPSLSHRGAIATVIIDAAIPVLVLLQILILAQIAEAVRLSRDLGIAAHRRSLALRWPVWTLLAAKVSMVALGVAGLLPGPLGDALADVRTDGAVSWLLAAILALGAGWWVVRGERWSPAPERNSESAVQVGSWAVIAALSAPLALVGVSYALANVARLGSGQWPDAITRVAAAAFPWAIVGAVAAVSVTGIVLLARGAQRGRSLGMLLAVFGVWGMPRAVTIARDLLTYPAFEYPIGDPGDFAERGVEVAGWVDPVTLDVALTVVLVTLVIAAGRDGRRTADRAVLLVLITTLSLYAGNLVPDGLRQGLAFHVGLVFPDGTGSGRRGHHRGDAGR